MSEKTGEAACASETCAMAEERDMLKHIVEELGGKFAMTKDEVERARRLV